MTSAKRNLQMMVFERQNLFCLQHIDIVQVIKVLKEGNQDAIQIVECLFGCSAIDIESILLRQVSSKIDKVNRQILIIESCLKRVQDCPADSFPSDFMNMFPDIQEHEIIMFLQSERTICVQRFEELSNIRRLLTDRRKLSVKLINQSF